MSTRVGVASPLAASACSLKTVVGRSSLSIVIFTSGARGSYAQASTDYPQVVSTARKAGAWKLAGVLPEWSDSVDVLRSISRCLDL